MVASNKPRQRVDLCAPLVDFPDDGRGCLALLVGFLELLDLGGLVGAVRVYALDAQGPFDSHLPVAERGVVEYLALFRLLKVEEDPADSLNVLCSKFAIFLAQILAKGPEPLGGVD